MMRLRLWMVLLGLLLPMVGSCSQPSGTYQRATIRDRDGVPCFGVPNTRETRAAPPLITMVSVGEVGKGNETLWERVFFGPGSVEPAMPPDQCFAYGEGGVPASDAALRAGKGYEVVISGYTPGTPGNDGEAQKRVFNACFYMVEVAGKGVMKPVVSDCATAHSSGP